MKILLIVVIVFVPIVGFISMLRYARGADTVPQRRQRKRHAMIFWVVLPAIAGVLVIMSSLEIIPQVMAPITVIALAAISLVGAQWQSRIEDK